MDVIDHLDKLKVFVAVAERRSISAASQELALSQPAITRAIQTLEHALGFKLFNRDRHGMHLTEGGSTFLAASSRVLKEIKDAAVKGAFVQDEMSGSLTIGTYESLAEYLWPSFLLEVQKLYPLLSLSLKTNSQSGHSAELSSGLLDFLVDAEPRNLKSFTSWPLYTDKFSLYSRKKVSLSGESASQLSLLTVRGVFDEDSVTLEQHFRQAELKFHREYFFDSFTTVKRMAMKGVGIAVLPRRLVNPADGLHLVSASGLKESFAPHRIYATVSPHREKDKRVKTLIGLLKKQLSSHVG